MDDNNFMRRLGSRLFAHPAFDELVAMSTSRDGFKRERAVRRLGLLGDVRAITCLIVRANDWVPEVRAAAYDALVRMLKAGNGELFVAALPQILRLESCQRGDHTPLLSAVREFLHRDENRTALLEGINNPDRRVARIVARMLVDRQLVAPTELLSQGLAHGDVLVRSITVELLQRLTPDEFEAAASMATRDSYMPVRREAFQLLLRRLPQRGLVVARDFLFDRSASIREIAIRHLLAVGEPVEDIYARALSADGRRVAVVKRVLWAWGFMNSQARNTQVRQFLDVSSPAIRRAALLCITRLLRTDAAADLERALADSSPPVSKEAARLVSRLRVAPGVERLMTIAASSRLTHVAYACCHVARDGNKWDWLRFILGVYGQSACDVSSETFSREIDAWERRFNRSAAQPDPRQLAAVVQLFGASRDRLSVQRARLLEFTLRTYVRDV